MLGTTIAHYRITEKLGEGGMGVVFKAEDTMLGRTVALKFLADRSLDADEPRKRFMREAQASAKLDHPNICTVYGLEEIDGHRFLVMAYMDGETLHDRMRRGALSLRLAIETAIQIGEGLREAHEKGIVHRDIKPANIFVTRKGVVKIGDFGLAFLVDRSRITQAGKMLGTVNYMSPEQFLADTVDRRADVWALGIVLYEMVCGCLPFRAADAQSALRLILNEQPKATGKMRKGCPAELDRVVRKALAKDREERYQYVDDFIVDLRAVVEHLPEEAPPGGSLPRRSDPNSPTETVQFDSNEVTAASEPVGSDGRRTHWSLLVFAVLVILGVAAGWWRFLRN